GHQRESDALSHSESFPSIDTDHYLFFFFSSRRRHTRSYGDWSSDVCSSDLTETSGRSFSSATSPTIPKTFGRRSRTPSISANGLHSILTGASVALAPQSSRQWGRRRRMYPRPR